MGHRKFNDVVGDIGAARRVRIDTIKEAARADAVAFNLAELRRHRQLTQMGLAERLERAQASTSAMETADDNLLSTVRSVLESMVADSNSSQYSTTNGSLSPPDNDQHAGDN